MKFKQETAYYCGPASLRILQTLLGVRKPFTQKQWARVAGTNPTRGTSVSAMKRCVSGLVPGIAVIKELPRTLTPFKNPAIVFDSIRNHWMVAQTSGNMLCIYDPETGRKKLIEPTEFAFKYLKSTNDFYAIVIP